MAIQPIDLQSLFSQLDKVGKEQALLKGGQQIQDSLHQLQTQRKMEENVRSVNEAQNMGEETAKVKDKKEGGNQPKSGGKGKQEDEEEDSKKENPDIIMDPSLGRNIDISG